MTDDTRVLGGRYRLEQVIGRGGMGEVWRATDEVLGRPVAVKTLRLGAGTDPTHAARFEREVRTTARLNDPGIVTVHDSGIEGDTAYLVMELLPGPSLADRLQAGPLPVEEVVSVGKQVARALAAAHAAGLVHRDIKPGNVMYAADGSVKVLDFGITQLSETTAAGQGGLTATQTVVGTADYLSPEQAIGGRVDGRADLYALGCLLYTLLAGAPPYAGATPIAVLVKHANDPVPDVRVLRPEVPAALASVVGWLMAKEPADRPASGAAVAQALAGAAGGAAGGTAVTEVLPVSPVATRVLPTTRPHPMSAAPDPVARYGPPPPPERSPSRWPLVVGLLVLGLVAFLAWRLWFADATPASTAKTATAASTTKAPAPKKTTTAAPTTSVPAGGGVGSAAIGAATEALQKAVDATGVEQKVRDQIDQDLRRLGTALQDGAKQKAVNAADGLRKTYDKAVDKGDIGTAAGLVLGPLVDTVVGAVDAWAG